MMVRLSLSMQCVCVTVRSYVCVLNGLCWFRIKFSLTPIFVFFSPKAWLSEVEGKVAARSDRRHSSDINHLVTQGRERSLFCLYYFYLLC